MEWSTSELPLSSFLQTISNKYLSCPASDNDVWYEIGDKQGYEVVRSVGGYVNRYGYT